MAEFREVMRQMYRMTDNGKKEGHLVFEGKREGAIGKMRVEFEGRPEKFDLFAELVEKNVLEWAAEHPEPKYPSWNEAWKQLFPDMAEKHPPCPRYFISSARLEEFCPGTRCKDCFNKPVPAAIAEKLGIKPIGGVTDEKA